MASRPWASRSTMTVDRDGVAKRVKGVRLYGDGLIRAQFAEFTS